MSFNRFGQPIHFKNREICKSIDSPIDRQTHECRLKLRSLSRRPLLLRVTQRLMAKLRLRSEIGHAKVVNKPRENLLLPMLQMTSHLQMSQPSKQLKMVKMPLPRRSAIETAASKQQHQIRQPLRMVRPNLSA